MGLVLGEISANVRADTGRFLADLNAAAVQGNQWQRSMENGNSTLSASFARVGASVGSAFSTVGNTIRSAGESIRSIGTSLTKYVTLPLAAMTAAALKLGMAFETSLSKVTGLVGVSQAQVGKWGSEILTLAPKLGKAPKELADALFFVTSAGIKGGAAMDVLKLSAKASAAGLGETKTVADLVTSAMNAYGVKNLSAAKATDIVTMAVREGKAEASELASSMGQVLPLASEMGVSFDQVAAAQAAMTRTGTSASEASTQLKAILSGMLKPSKQAEEQLKKMGTSSAEMRKKIKEEGLLSALSELRTLTNKYGEEAMAKVYPNIRGLMGVLDLMGSNAKENAVIFDHVANSQGTLNEAFKASSQTLEFKWNQALSKVKATAIGFFNSLKEVMIPVLNVVIGVLDRVGNAFNGLPKSIQMVVLAIAGIAAAIGPALIVVGSIIAIFGSAIAGIGTIITVVSGIIGTVGLPAIAAIGVIVTGVIATILAWIGTFVYLWKTNEQFRTNVITAWNAIKANAIETFNGIKLIIMTVFSAIQSFWQAHGSTLSQYWALLWNGILNTVVLITGLINNAVKIFGGILKGDWSMIWNGLKGIAGNVMAYLYAMIGSKIEAIKNIFVSKLMGILNSVLGLIPTFKNAMMQLFSGGITGAITTVTGLALNAGLKIVNSLMQGVRSLAASFRSTVMTTVINGVTGAISAAVGICASAGMKIINTLMSGIRSMAGSLRSTALSTVVNAVTGAVSSAAGTCMKAGVTVVNRMMSGVRSLAGSFRSSVLTTLVSGVTGAISSAAGTCTSAGRRVVTTLMSGVRAMAGSFRGSVLSTVVSGVTGAIASAAGACISAGKRIVQSIISGIKSVSLAGAGSSIVNSLIGGISSRMGALSAKASQMAATIRNKLPFSPAKEGPLKDLNKVDFYSSIAKALDKARSRIDIPAMALSNEIAAGLSSGGSGVSGFGNSSKNINFNGPMNFNGIQDTYQFMKEMRSVIMKHTGRVI